MKFVLLTAASLLLMNSCHTQSQPKHDDLLTPQQRNAIPIDSIRDIVVNDSVETLITMGGRMLKAHYIKPAGEPYEMSKVAPPGVFTFVEKMPQFPGGEDGLNIYISKNIRMPKEIEAYGPPHVIFIQYVITATGNVRCINITSQPQPIDTIIRRIMHTMPRWKPGEQGGKKVAVQLFLPIHIELQE